MQRYHLRRVHQSKTENLSTKNWMFDGKECIKPSSIWINEVVSDFKFKKKKWVKKKHKKTPKIHRVRSFFWHRKWIECIFIRNGRSRGPITCFFLDYLHRCSSGLIESTRWFNPNLKFNEFNGKNDVKKHPMKWGKWKKIT